VQYYLGKLDNLVSCFNDLKSSFKKQVKAIENLSNKFNSTSKTIEDFVNDNKFMK